MNRIAAIVLLLAATAVAQHQQGNVANVPDQKFDIPSVQGYCYSITAPKPTTKVACEKVGGTWDTASFYFYTPLSTAAQEGSILAPKDFKQSVDVDSQTGRVVKLSDEEYARLQKLRQAVADEEKKIAVAHGVDTEGDLYPCGKPSKDYTNLWESGIACEMPVGWNYKYPDRWQFRGQFLLINVPRKETK